MVPLPSTPCGLRRDKMGSILDRNRHNMTINELARGRETFMDGLYQQRAKVVDYARILAALRTAETSVSGETLCRELGVSRTAVWKAVKHLRDRGYEIDSAPHRGYTLISAPEAPTALEVLPGVRTRFLGRRYDYHPSVESTNRLAAEAAAEGAPAGTVIAADRQTGGRGRLSRAWHSPPGRNLYLSLVLRPPIEPVAAPQLALVAAPALIRAVEQCTDASPALAVKWPNDVYLDGRKLAGILCEMKAEIDRVHHLIIGLGVNVNGYRFPPEIAGRATSLEQALAKPCSRAALTTAFLNAFEEAYDRWLAEGLGPARRVWRERSLLRGRRIRVTGLNRDITGRAVDLTLQGGLVIEESDGVRTTIASGDAHIADF